MERAPTGKFNQIFLGGVHSQILKHAELKCLLFGTKLPEKCHIRGNR